MNKQNKNLLNIENKPLSAKCWHVYCTEITRGTVDRLDL